MIFTQGLSTKEKTYLVELFRHSKISPYEISIETLNSLKPGVLQTALALQPNLDLRKKKILNKILDKIVYSGILLDGELAPAKVFLENTKEQ